MKYLKKKNVFVWECEEIVEENTYIELPQDGSKRKIEFKDTISDFKDCMCICMSNNQCTSFWIFHAKCTLNLSTNFELVNFKDEYGIALPPGYNAGMSKIILNIEGNLFLPPPPQKKVVEMV